RRRDLLPSADGPRRAAAGRARARGKRETRAVCTVRIGGRSKPRPGEHIEERRAGERSGGNSRAEACRAETPAGGAAGSASRLGGARAKTRAAANYPAHITRTGGGTQRPDAEIHRRGGSQPASHGRPATERRPARHGGKDSELSHPIARSQRNPRLEPCPHTGGQGAAPVHRARKFALGGAATRRGEAALHSASPAMKSSFLVCYRHQRQLSEKQPGRCGRRTAPFFVFCFSDFVFRFSLR